MLPTQKKCINWITRVKVFPRASPWKQDSLKVNDGCSRLEVRKGSRVFLFSDTH